MAERREDVRIRIEGEDNASDDLRRAAQATEELGDEAQRTESRLDRMAAEMDRMRGAVGNLTGVLGKAKAAVGAFFALESVQFVKEFVTETIAAAAAAGEFADALGLDIERFSALEKAFGTYGTNADVFRDGLATLAEKLAEVREENEEAVELFERYGVAANDAAVKTGNVAEVLVKLADGYNQSTDANQKYVDSLALFGSEAAKSLIGPLNEGTAALEKLTKAARDNGDALTKEQVKASLESTKAINDMTDAFGQLASDITLTIGPSLAASAKYVSGLTLRVKEFLDSLERQEQKGFGDQLIAKVKVYQDRLAELEESTKKLTIAQASYTKQLAFYEETGNGATAAAQRYRDKLEEVDKNIEKNIASHKAVAAELARVRKEYELTGNAAADATRLNREAAEEQVEVAKDSIEDLIKLHRQLFTQFELLEEAQRDAYAQFQQGIITFEEYQEKLKEYTAGIAGFIQSQDGFKTALITSNVSLGDHTRKLAEVDQALSDGIIKSYEAYKHVLFEVEQGQKRSAAEVKKAQTEELERVKKLADAYGRENLDKLIASTDARVAAIQKAIAATDDEIKQGKLRVEQYEIESVAARNKAKVNNEEALSIDHKIQRLKDEIQAGAKNAEEKQKEIAQLEVQSAAKRKEAEESRKVAQEKLAEAEATRQAVKEKEEEAKATARLEKEQARATERAEQMAAATDFVNTQLGNAVGYLKQFSDAAVREFTAYLTGSRAATASTDALTDALRDTEERLVRTEQAFGRADGFARWANRITAASLEIGQQFLNQAIRAREFVADIDRLTESSTELTARQLTQLRTLANANVDAFNLLDDARLDALNAAIGRASDKLRELQDEAKEAKAQLAGIGDQLRDELDRLRGDETAIEQRRYEQQLRNIEELSKLGGDAARAEAAAAERLAEQIHQANLRRIREEREQRALGSERPSGGGGTGASTRAGSGGGGGITVNFPNAKLIDRDFWEHEALPQLNRIAKLRTQKNLI